MDWSKAKNIIIGMLVIVNVFLLVVCWIAERGRLSVQETVVAETVSYLAERGTSIDAAIIPTETDACSTLLVARDFEAEKTLAETLIGGTELSRIGGIVRFSSEDGSSSAMWRAGGLFEASAWISGASEYTGEAASHPAIAHLASVGFVSDDVKDAESGGLRQIVLTQTQDGLPIFNAALTVTCGAQDAVYTAGRWCVGAVQAISAADEMEVTGLLIRFVEQMRENGVSVYRIDGIRHGYIAQNIANSGVKLIPAWEITTPGAVNYISAVDGTLLVSE